MGSKDTGKIRRIVRHTIFQILHVKRRYKNASSVPLAPRLPSSTKPRASDLCKRQIVGSIGIRPIKEPNKQRWRGDEYDIDPSKHSFARLKNTNYGQHDLLHVQAMMEMVKVWRGGGLKVIKIFQSQLEHPWPQAV
jgi:hypothetical protein